MSHPQPDNPTLPVSQRLTAPGLPLPLPKVSNRGWRIAVAASVLVHAVLLIVAVKTWGPSLRGGGGQLLDAIEFEVTGTDALESPARTMQTGGGAAAAMATDEGAAAPVATLSPVAAAVAQPAAAAGGMPVTDTPTPDVVAAARPEPPLPDRPTVQPAPVDADAPPDAAARPDAAVAVAQPVAAAAGGAVAIAPSNAAPVPAAAAASPGEIERFRGEVRRALSQNPPRRATRGPAVAALLVFTVSKTGRVENAALLEASSDASTNAFLLTWITAAPMPVPHPNLTSAERTYCIPVGATRKQIQRHESCR